MARRLALAILLFSGLVFGQALSGSWSTKIVLLPPPVGLESLEFTLQGKLLDWTLGGKAEFFGTDGWVWQTFTAQGRLGPAESEWTLLFGPLAPAFLYCLGKTSLVVSGLELSLYSAYVGPNGPYVFTGGPSGGTVVEAEQNINGISLTLELGFGARKQDFTIIYSGVGTYTKTMPVDPFPGGFSFTYLELGLEGVSLCCGLSMDIGFAFTKEGFDSVSFLLKEAPLCCGISFDVEVKFTTTAKEVNIKPKWAGIEGCLTVYGDVNFAGGVIGGIEVYGLKLRCDLGDCTYAEFLTALNVAKVEEILKKDIFQNAEFEYVQLGFCGAGCCGGRWTLDVSLFFKPSGGLFGLSRVLLDASIPVMANFSVDLGLSAAVGAQAGLTVGWTFTF